MFDLFLNKEEALAIKENLLKKPLAVLSLRQQAEVAFADKLYCVTEHKSPAVSGNPHDYFSEGPYWWPNPEDPDGPYIRRDGERNPNVFLHHHHDLTVMNQNVYLLCAAAYYLDEPRYAQRALEVMQCWFVNEETKMNPHMRYAQAIRGIVDGRGIGIIDCRILIGTVMGCWYLTQLGYEESLTDVKAWFRQFLHWMNTDPQALDEKFYHNNHANWFNTQNAAYAVLCEDKTYLEEFFTRYCEVIIPNQMGVDGSFADELARTNSFSYSRMNLDGCALLCEIAWHNGHDLYHFTDKDGKGFAKGVEFLKPYCENTFKWQYQQIGGSLNRNNISLQLAGARLGDAEAEKIDAANSRHMVMPYNDEFGIFELMAGGRWDNYLE